MLLPHDQGTAQDSIAKKAQAAIDKGRLYLERRQLSEGFPYKDGQKHPSTEATAWCAIALRHDKTRADQLADCLVRQQQHDGGWSSQAGFGHSDWNSGPALLALRILTHEHGLGQTKVEIRRAINKGADYLIDSQFDFWAPIGRFVIFLWKGQNGWRYGRGWPWNEGCFHWVEPTSYNLMALKIPHRLGRGHDEVIARAHQFLFEHSCQEGGWNYGNSAMLGAKLPPYTVTTAEALLAVQDVERTKDMDAAVSFLEKVEQVSYSALERAWAALALSALGEIRPGLLEVIVDSQGSDGHFGMGLMHTALSILALEAALGENALKTGMP